MGKAKLKSQGIMQDIGLLVLRVVLGAAMLFGHGIGKWAKLFGEEAIKFADPIGMGPVASLSLAVLAEVICSALIIAGLLSRWAVVPLLITMLVALFIVHGADDFGTQEKAILYAGGYLTLLLTGPGRFSVDHYLSGKR